MNYMIRLAMLLTVAFMTTVVAYSKNVRFTTNSLDATHVIEFREVVDTISLNKMLADSVAKIEKIKTEYAAQESNYRALIDILGKKIPESLMPQAQEVVAIFGERERNNMRANMEQRNNRRSSNISALSLLGAVASVYKDAKKLAKKLPAEKDLEKGKLSKDTEKTIYDIIDWYAKSSQKCGEILDKARTDGAESVFSIKDKPTHFVTDTVPNPNHRSKIYNTEKWNTNSDWKQLVKGWEWLNDKNEKVEYKKMKYPYEISYYVYDSHPEYFVISSSNDSNYKVVYDHDGNLVYISDYNNPIFYDLKNQILKIEFDNNAHEIKSANSLVQHKVKLILGLDKMTAAEKANAARLKKNADKMIKNMMNHSKASRVYGKNSVAAKKAGEKFFWDMVSAPKNSSAADEEALKIADRWVEQIKEDWTEGSHVYLKKPYRYERVSPTTFKLTYVDKDIVPRYEIYLKYSQKGAFRCDEELTITRVQTPIKDNVSDEIVLLKEEE